MLSHKLNNNLYDIIPLSMPARSTIQAGHPSLKKKNKKITDLQSKVFIKLKKDLVDTMTKTDLIGIAAPQIAENYMVFVTHARNTKSRNIGKKDKLRFYINPRITYESKTKSIIYEGCGSVVEGDLFGPVIRPKEIEVEALDEKGEKFSLKCDGILARVIQHEYDHLMGIEFIEKVADYKKVIVGEHYREMIKNSKQQKQNSLITKVVYKKA
jgi:peptide deformylase